MGGRAGGGWAGGQARAVWAAAVRELRAGRGWSQPRFAQRIQAANRLVKRVTIATEHVERVIQYWEAGATLPGTDYAVVLVAVFASRAELATGTIAPGSDLERLVDAFERMGASVQRRRFLLNAAAAAVVGAETFAGWEPVPADLAGEERLAWVLRHPGRVDVRTAAWLLEEAVALAGRVDQAAARGVLPRVLARGQQLAVLLASAPAEPVRQPLLAAQAHVSVSAGWLWSGVYGERGLARRYYRTGLALAGEAGEPAAAARARGRLAALAFYVDGDLAGARGHAAGAVAAARQAGSPTLRCHQLAFHGELLAAAGEERAALGELDAAREQLAAAGAGDPFCGMFGEDDFLGFAGAYWLRLGRPGRARGALEAAAAAARAPRRRVIVLADLAVSHARQGDPVAACAALGRALDAQAAGPTSNGAERVRMALGALRPWRQEPCVREVTERAALRTPT